MIRTEGVITAEAAVMAEEGAVTEAAEVVETGEETMVRNLYLILKLGCIKGKGP